MAEFTAYLEEPLRPLLSSTELFLLAGNHEIYSRGIPFLRYLDHKRERLPGRQRQEGSYFRLVSERFQIIGMDTEWWVHGRIYPDHIEILHSWLAAGHLTAAALRFVETDWRFAPYRQVREDVANNGYGVLRLCADGSAQLVYLDWWGRERHTAQVARGGDGSVRFLD